MKVSLSTKENPGISDDLNKNISLLGKNYNDMKTKEEPDLNIKRVDNIHKCLNLFKENVYDYKLFKPDGAPYLNNNNLGLDVNSKKVLQVCSNSYDTISIISDLLCLIQLLINLINFMITLI